MAGHEAALPYGAIYKMSCSQENISCDPDNVHPEIRLRPPTNREVLRDTSPIVVDIVVDMDPHGGRTNEEVIANRL